MKLEAVAGTAGRSPGRGSKARFPCFRLAEAEAEVTAAAASVSATEYSSSGVSRVYADAGVFIRERPRRRQRPPPSGQSHIFTTPQLSPSPTRLSKVLERLGGCWNTPQRTGRKKLSSSLMSNSLLGGESTTSWGHLKSRKLHFPVFMSTGRAGDDLVEPCSQDTSRKKILLFGVFQGCSRGVFYGITHAHFATLVKSTQREGARC